MIDNLFKAFELKQAGFNLVDSGSGAALAGAIRKAYSRGEGVRSYLLGPHEANEFIECIGVADCTDPKPKSFATSDIKTVVAADFAKRIFKPWLI